MKEDHHLKMYSHLRSHLQKGVPHQVKVFRAKMMKMMLNVKLVYFSEYEKKTCGFVKNTAVPAGAVTARQNTEKHVAYTINTNTYTFLSWFTHMALLRGGTEWNCSNLPV